ncbi:MAG: AAA family ATPase [Bacteroidota bacterium]
MNLSETPRVAFMGAHGSGKTTLILEIASRLKKRGINCSIAYEVARKSPYVIRGLNTIEAQLQLLGARLNEEMSACINSQVVLCDRSMLDIQVYTDVFCPKPDNGESANHGNYRNLIRDFSVAYTQTYSKVFFTSTLYSQMITKDDLRPEGEDFQRKVQNLMEEELNKSKVRFEHIPDNEPVDYLVNEIVKLIK